jgi:hypothetical protein
MDAGILRFSSETALEVSYGADRCQARAKRRQVKRWDLAAALARAPR